MKSKKMHPDAVMYFIGEHPVKLSKDCQTILSDSGYTSFEVIITLRK